MLHVISFSISFIYEDDTNSHMLIILYIFFYKLIIIINRLQIISRRCETSFGLVN